MGKAGPSPDLPICHVSEGLGMPSMKHAMGMVTLPTVDCVLGCEVTVGGAEGDEREGKHTYT
jgi:hypothetical protein